jgi:predicted ATPase
LGNVEYFAALNTGQGFRSFFREIFDPIGRVYVIKGGPGTGKSRLMRELEAAANERGYSSERILCSSDPSSLDGIIIPTIDVAVLDGTSPHVHEPTLVGIRESFVDLGVFLDREKLSGRRTEIEALASAKGRRYAQIYGYIQIISSYENSVLALASRAALADKLEKSVAKYSLYAPTSKKYEKKIRIRSTFSENGRVTLDGYSSGASKRFAVRDVCGIGRVFLKKLLEATERKGAKVTVSYDPVMPDMPDALYYPDSGASFYIGCEGANGENIINTARFVDDMTHRAYKPEIRAIGRLKNSVTDQLKLDIANVRRLHSSLEEIYSSAMDFKAKEAFTAEFINSILK